MLKVLSASAVTLMVLIVVMLLVPDADGTTAKTTSIIAQEPAPRATTTAAAAPTIATVTPANSAAKPAQLASLTPPSSSPEAVAAHTSQAVAAALAEVTGITDTVAPQTTGKTPRKIAPTPRPELAAVEAEPQVFQQRSNAEQMATIVELAQNAEGDTDQDRVRALTRSVLADLGVTISDEEEKEEEAKEEEAAAKPAPNAEMQDMTNGVLASLSALRGKPEEEQKKGLEDLIVQSLTEGGEEEFDDLLRHAEKSGMVVIPAEMVTSDGKVDTRTLLASIASKARAENAVSSTKVTAASNTASVASTAVRRPDIPPAPPLGPGRTYRVTSGDSLAYIALLYYGDTSQYTRIFEANKDKLTSASKIQIGQRLVIPK